MGSTTSGTVNNATNNVNGIVCYVDLWFVNNASTGSQKTFTSCQPFYQTDDGGTVTVASLVLATIGVTNFGTSSIDTSQPGVLSVTMTNSTTQACTTTFRGAIVEKID